MTISEKAKVTTERLEKFMDKHVYPNNSTYHQQIEDFGDNRWQVVPIIEDLKEEAKKEEHKKEQPKAEAKKEEPKKEQPKKS